MYSQCAGLRFSVGKFLVPAGVRSHPGVDRCKRCAGFTKPIGKSNPHFGSAWPQKVCRSSRPVISHSSLESQQPVLTFAKWSVVLRCIAPHEIHNFNNMRRPRSVRSKRTEWVALGITPIFVICGIERRRLVGRFSLECSWHKLTSSKPARNSSNLCGFFSHFPYSFRA